MSDRRLKIETLEARHLLAAQPLITEFMASNAGVLVDGNGAESDWIEIHNAGDQSIDLAGYRLTDDAGDPSKWEFPSVVLDAGAYLTVFASGDGTPDAAGNLHTNFALSAGGEYLAFVSPLGAIVTEFGSATEDYPPQTADVSYGFAMETTVTDAVTPTSAARYLIPSNAAVDGAWTAPGFSDGAWTQGTASLGYENSPADYQDLIDTVVPVGTTSVYVRVPFTVNDTAMVLDKLRMRYDDGFVAYLNGTRVASANAPEDLAFDSLATEDHPDVLAAQYVDFDLSGTDATLNAGVNVLAIHMLNRSPSSDMLVMPNLVLTSGLVIQPELVGYLASPTPGLPNTNVTASDVVFSRPGGVFSGGFLLAMTAAPGESIRYTTDGTNPDAGSPLYTGALTVDSTQQFRARAFGSAGQIGRVAAATYVRAQAAVAGFTSDLPIVVLENLGAGVPDRDYQDSSFALYDVDPATGFSSLAAAPDVTSLSAQHRRGRSTFSQPKLNLRLELRDALGDDQSQSLLGMPSESDWVLYAPWTIDRAMVRHSLIYDLGRQTGRWAPRTRFVEVFSNYDGGDLSDNDYVGAYVLMENIKRDGDRVEITALNPTQNTEPDITGGYLLQVGDAGPEDNAWDSSRGFPRGVSQYIPEDPDGDELTPAQSDYIRGYIDDFEDALFGPNFTDPEVGFRAYFDADAAIDFHLLNTFSANPDAFRLSTYLTKDRGGKLAYGPLWDFDRGMGPDLDDRAADPTEWLSDPAYLWVTQYWNRLFDDPNFEQQWVDRWQELRQTVLSEDNLTATLRAQTDQLATAQARNADRWGAGIAPNGGPLSTEGGGWAGEVSHLENWLLARVAWIDGQTIGRPAMTPEPGGVGAGTRVTLAAQPGSTVYYTTDGSDPRADGGGVSPNAVLYQGPISVSETTQITARARGAGDFFGGWSGLTEGRFAIETPADALNLRVSELHYHPTDPSNAELAAAPGTGDNDYEFIELVNISDEAISLAGVRFVDGITFDFSAGSVAALAPGEAVVVVENATAFAARYGTGPLVAGVYDGNLSNGGEDVALIDADDQPIQAFAYSDDPPWPTTPDGDGPSLEVVSTLVDYNNPFNWRASDTPQGTPGVAPLFGPGDYDRNGVVERADNTVWASSYGSTNDLSADGNRNGIIDAGDYTIWRDRFEEAAAALLVPAVTANVGIDSASAPTATRIAAKPSGGAPVRELAPPTEPRQRFRPSFRDRTEPEANRPSRDRLWEAYEASHAEAASARDATHRAGLSLCQDPCAGRRLQRSESDDALEVQRDAEEQEQESEQDAYDWDRAFEALLKESVERLAVLP